MFALRPVLLLALEVVFCILATTTALAQGDDIFQRLRRALATSGQGELASAALARKNFAQVEEILAESRPSTPEARAELLSLRGAVEIGDDERSRGWPGPVELSFVEHLRVGGHASG